MTSAPWDPDRPLDAALASSALRENFADLPVRSVALLGQGWDFDAYLVNDSMVFRFPRRRESESKLLFEIEFLEQFAPLSPVHVPVYSLEGAPGQTFPYTFACYSIVQGRSGMESTLPASSIAAEGQRMGSFLSLLHGQSIDRALALGVETLGEADTPEGVRAASIDDLEWLKGVMPAALFDRVSAYFEDVTNMPEDYTGPSRLVHRDLGAEHIILSEDHRRIAGVIDWSDVSIGDPAIDFAALWAWLGDAIVEAALETYDLPVDAGLAGRVRYIGTHMAVANLSYGFHAGRAEYMSAGLAWLGRIFEGRQAKE
ncbi:MAG: hypothetical protein FJ319_11325 [SAR202 cluster bacterium]|nr:hypothetical protein [SAR202 cluster bacterium]